MFLCSCTIDSVAGREVSAPAWWRISLRQRDRPLRVAFNNANAGGESQYPQPCPLVRQYVLVFLTSLCSIFSVKSSYCVNLSGWADYLVKVFFVWSKLNFITITVVFMILLYLGAFLDLTIPCTLSSLCAVVGSNGQSILLFKLRILQRLQLKLRMPLIP
jgi:hypothetical protein